MKNIFCGLLIIITVASCLAPPSNSTSGNPSASSAEMEARRLTTKMKTALTLNSSQEEKVMVINVVNLSLLKKLREGNQIEQISKTQEKYRSEMREVLNTDQYSKFLTEFGNI
ncbi:MAG TPA: hypothetical protein VK175_09195 [Leadbetterella sp.]|nr:hypothetical protein [Leadbetterella sp.]